MDVAVSHAGDLPFPAKAGQSVGAAQLTLTVAFAGHRRLAVKDLAHDLKAVFNIIAAATNALGKADAGGDTIIQAHGAIWPDRAPMSAMRLLVGYAPGADQIAAQVWRDLRLGEIHALFPFADKDPTRFAWTDDPQAQDIDPSLRIEIAQPRGLSGGFDHFTVLDGAAAQTTRPFRHPHLEQSRWLLRWSDIVVVAWDGARPNKLGGTADLVALALAASQPVVWIDTSPSDRPPSLIMPSRLWHDSVFGEVHSSLQGHATGEGSDPLGPLVDLSEESLAKVLVARFSPPFAPNGEDEGRDQETRGRKDYSKALEHTWWGSIAQSIAAQWQRFYRTFGSNTTEEDRSPRSSVSPLIAARLKEADEIATFLGGLHRGAQVLLLVLAVLAVFAGAFPALLPEAKSICVVVELVLILLAFGLYLLLGQITTDQRWSDARRLAERMRALNATWPLGFDAGDERSDAPATWTEWYARAVRRSAGPPTGVLSRDYRRRMGDVARKDLAGIVAGQHAYHEVAGIRAHGFHRLLHRLEKGVSVSLACALAIFIAFDLSAGHEHFPHWVSGGLLLASAVFPAIAAACLAIEAKLGLIESHHRSEALRARFAKISDRMSRPAPTGGSEQHDLRVGREQRDEELLREAAMLVIADVDRWRDASAHRIIATF